MQDIIDTLKRVFREKPLEFIAAMATLLYTLSRIIAALGDARGSHAYARQVNYRIKHAR